MYWMPFGKGYFLSLLLASLCLLPCPGKSQDAPTTVPRNPWRDPQVGEKYKQWLKEDVVYIVTDQERKEFRNLTADKQRDEFIAAFWERRNPMPGSAPNSFKEEHHRRIAYVNQHFGAGPIPGWKTDRGRVYIVYGPADSVEPHLGFSPPTEIWNYASAEGLGRRAVFTFTDNDYHLTDLVVDSLPRIRDGQRVY